jgi:hypothetical protein
MNPSHFLNTNVLLYFYRHRPHCHLDPLQGSGDYFALLTAALEIKATSGCS